MKVSDGGPRFCQQELNTPHGWVALYSSSSDETKGFLTHQILYSSCAIMLHLLQHRWFAQIENAEIVF